MSAFVRAVRTPLLVAAVAPLLLVACRPVEPGAAALIGHHTITVDTLQRLTNRVIAAADAQTRAQIAGDPTALARLQRSILSRLLNDEVLDAAAQQLGVNASEGEIDQEQGQLEQQAGGQTQLLQQALMAGIAPDELRTALRGLVLSRKVGAAVVAGEPVSTAQLRTAYQQNIDAFDQVHAAHILVSSKAEADSILTRVRANPSSFARLAAQYSQDTTTSNSGGDLGTVGPSRLDPSFAKAVFAAKPGSYIEVHSSFGWHVVHVIAHHTVSLTAAEPELRATVLQAVSQQRVAALLQSIAQRLHIRVNPRYGAWKAGSVAELPNDLSSPEVTPTPASTLAPGTGAPPSG